MKTVEYRAEIEQALNTRFPSREFLRPLNYRLLWFFPHVLTTVIAAWAITRTEWLAFKLAESLIIGSSFASLGFLGHEFLHGSIVKRRWLGGLMGGICMAPFAVSPTVWRWWHNDQHHGHTQVYSLDPDASARVEEYPKRAGLRVLIWLTAVRGSVILPLLGFWFPFHNLLMLRAAMRRLPAKRVSIMGQLTLAVVAPLALGWWSGFGNWLLIYCLPVYIGGFVLMSFIATNHLLNQQTSEDDMDPVTTSLSLRIPWLFRVLYLNFNFHTAHHLYKHMSSKYAPQITEVVKRVWPERYHELSWPGALLALCRTPRIYLDEFTLVDPLRDRKYGVLGHGLDLS